MNRNIVFQDLVELLHQYYPFGVSTQDANYRNFPGYQKLKTISVDKKQEELEMNLQWKKLLEEIKASNDQCIDTSSLISSSYSLSFTVAKKVTENLEVYKSIHLYLNAFHLIQELVLHYFPEKRFVNMRFLKTQLKNLQVGSDRSGGATVFDALYGRSFDILKTENYGDRNYKGQ